MGRVPGKYAQRPIPDFSLYLGDAIIKNLQFFPGMHLFLKFSFILHS